MEDELVTGGCEDPARPPDRGEPGPVDRGFYTVHRGQSTAKPGPHGAFREPAGSQLGALASPSERLLS